MDRVINSTHFSCKNESVFNLQRKNAFTETLSKGLLNRQKILVYVCLRLLSSVYLPVCMSPLI